MNQALNGDCLSAPASLTAPATARTISGRLLVPHGADAATPALLITASQLFFRIAVLMAILSVAEPSATLIWLYIDFDIKDSSFEDDLTKATTLWLCDRSAATSRRPTLPVAPMRRTFMIV